MTLAMSSDAYTAGWPSLVLMLLSSLPAENMSENTSKCFNASAKSVELLWYIKSNYNTNRNLPHEATLYISKAYT